MYFTVPSYKDVHDPVAAGQAAKRLVGMGAPAVPALIAALTSPDADVAHGVRDALTRIGAPAFEGLVMALAARDGEIRTLSEKALVNAGAPAVSALITALDDKDSGRRRAAARTLSQIGSRLESSERSRSWIAKIPGLRTKQRKALEAIRRSHLVLDSSQPGP
jgi:HEAT repeat protein